MKASYPKKQAKPKIRIKELNFQCEDFILNYENCADGYSEYPNFHACNLYLPKTVNKGKSNERTELKWDSYPTSREAILKIIMNRIIHSGNCDFKGKGDEGLAQFFSRYKEEREKFISLFNHTREEWLDLLEFDKKKKSYSVTLK